MRLVIALAVILGSMALAQAQQVVPGSQAQINLSFSPIVKKASPAVVNIYARRLVERRSPFAGDPFFENFFRGFDRPGLRQQNSLGSGVILDASGLVVSNYHVVANATDIRVVLSDRTEFDGTVVLADKNSDIAIIQLSGAQDLPVLELADSDLAEVGDLVLAIGNPFGVGQTVTSGIISALARGGVQGQAGYFVQTDAAINPGNSGGALVDISGRLLGVPTSILTRSGGSNGIGFAIPAKLVGAYLEAARAGQDQFTPPWSGMRVQSLDQDLADAYGLSGPLNGVLIKEIHEASPFFFAGMRQGDILLSLDGWRLLSSSDLKFRLSLLRPSDVVAVEWHRDGLRRSDIELSVAPEEPPSNPVEISVGPFAGLKVSNINPRIIEEMDLPFGAEGVVVTHVQGPVRSKRLQPGDILRQINRAKISDTADLEGLENIKSNRWRIEFLRDGRLLRLNVIE